MNTLKLFGALFGVVTGTLLTWYKAFVFTLTWNLFLAGWWIVPKITTAVSFGMLMVIMMGYENSSKDTTVSELFHKQFVQLIATLILWTVVVVMKNYV